MADSKPQSPRGRGTGLNPKNRFEGSAREAFRPDDDVAPPDETPSPKTEIFDDHSRSILVENDSPDVAARFTVNPYRGCEHGCVYCYARPFHEYLGLSAGIDFETKIFAKREAAPLLREALLAPTWGGDVIALSGVTDCYQPVERDLRLTRQCLEVLAEFKNPFAVVTKNRLVLRDLDLLVPMAKLDAAAVFVTVTTLDAELARKLEPRASTPAARLETIRRLAEAGVPVGTLVAPVIPGLTDHEVPAILAAVAKAGARSAAYVVLRLPHAVEALFADWLSEHAPLQREKVLGRLRELRGGKLYDSTFGTRMKGSGVFAAQLETMFRAFAKRQGLNERRLDLSSEHFARPGEQLTLDL